MPAKVDSMLQPDQQSHKKVVKLSDLSLITNRVRLPASEQGNMSCVETAIYNGQKVIIKTLKSDAPQYDIKQFRAEIDALKSVKSPELSEFVVELIAYCESPLALILEWCEGGTVYSYVTNNPNLPWEERLDLLMGITKGLLALHKREWETKTPSKSEIEPSAFLEPDRIELCCAAELVHRDLKPQNLLVTSKGRVKICDFGLSRYLKSGGTAATTIANAGSVNYMSPEQMEGGELTAACDIYAFGGLIYFMITGRQPWRGLTAAQINAAVLTASDRFGSILLHPKLPPLSDDVKNGLPPGLYDLMTDCLRYTPMERPPIQMISSRTDAIYYAADFVCVKDGFEGTSLLSVPFDSHPTCCDGFRHCQFCPKYERCKIDWILGRSDHFL